MKKTFTKIIPVTIEVEVTVTVDERPGTHLDPPECTIDWEYELFKVIKDLDNDINEQLEQLDYD